MRANIEPNRGERENPPLPLFSTPFLFSSKKRRLSGPIIDNDRRCDVSDEFVHVHSPVLVVKGEGKGVVEEEGAERVEFRVWNP